MAVHPCCISRLSSASPRNPSPFSFINFRHAPAEYPHSRASPSCSVSKLPVLKNTRGNESEFDPDISGGLRSGRTRPSMEKKGLRARSRKRLHATLRDLGVSALLFAWVTGPQAQWRALAQSCGSSSSSTMHVGDATELAALKSTLSNCTSGEVNVIWDGLVEVDGRIPINAGISLSIVGEGEAAEATGGTVADRLFYVVDGGELTLSQLKLSNGVASSGGAIYSSGTVTLNNCVFENNEASAGFGGAVRAEGGEVIITGGEFSGNKADVQGGAIYTGAAVLVVQNGTIFDNNLAVQGGAVFCTDMISVGSSVAAATPTCSFSDAVFFSNNASRIDAEDFDDLSETQWVSDNGGGGAVFVSADADFTDCEFVGNYAELSAGALFGDDETAVTITGCEFRDNYAEGYGGAVCVSSGTFGGGTIVRNNTAMKNGGGVSSHSTLTIILITYLGR